MLYKSTLQQIDFRTDCTFSIAQYVTVSLAFHPYPVYSTLLSSKVCLDLNIFSEVLTNLSNPNTAFCRIFRSATECCRGERETVNWIVGWHIAERTDWRFILTDRAYMCVCLCVCVFVCVCVCVITEQTPQIVKIPHEINTKFCFILYQSKKCEGQEVQTFRETHISYTKQCFNFASWIAKKESKRHCNSPQSHTVHTACHLTVIWPKLDCSSEVSKDSSSIIGLRGSL